MDWFQNGRYHASLMGLEHEYSKEVQPLHILKAQVPLVYMIIHTLWEVLVTFTTCGFILAALCLGLWLFNRARV